ncbi:PAS domain S-box protein [bacterium]|nr:MAG: PAS domain S-box protein [bacterium]
MSESTLENPKVGATSEGWPSPETRRVLDGMSEYFLAMDRSYRIVFVNRALEEAMPKGAEPLLGKSHWDLWPDMRGTIVEESYERAFALDLAVNFEYHYPKSDIWVSVNAYPHEGHLHVFFTNVTEQKRAEAERGGREALMRTLVDSMPQIAWASGTDMVPTYLNERWYDYTGFSPDAAFDLPACVYSEDLPTLNRMSLKAMTLGEGLQAEGRLRRKDGQYRWHLVRIEPRRNERGEVVGWLGTSTDIHDLKAAEEMLAATTDAVPNFIAFLDSGMLYRFCNRKFEEWFGLPRERIVGTHIRDLVGEAAFARLRGYLERALGGLRTEYAQWLVFGNGERRFMHATYVPSLHPDGTVAGVYAMIADETEAREAQESLQAREATLRFLADLGEETRKMSHGDAIIAYTARMLGQHLRADRCAYGEFEEDGETFVKIQDWSPSLPSLAGREFSLSQFGAYLAEPMYGGRTLVANDIEAEAPPEEAAAQVALGVRAMITNPLVKEGRLVAVMSVHSTTPRVWTPDEVSLVGLVVERCWTEIQRSRAERGLRQSESRLRQLLEAATVGVIVNDRQGRFTYCNPPLLTTLGYTKEDLAEGRLAWSLIQAPERIASDNRALDQLRASGSCEPYETELVTRDGGRVPVYVGAAFIPDESGGGVSGAAFVTDLTELKAAQRELEAINQELDERVRSRTAELLAANQALETYSHHVAHDLRAPLRAIVSTSRIIEEDFGDMLTDEVAAQLRRQVQAATRLGQLVDDLLKSSRLSREEMEKAEVDLTALALEARQEALAMHPSSQVTIEVQEGMRAKADPRLLRLALINLVENAVKYSPQGGTVRVGRGEDGSVFVSDQGIGIAEQYFGKIFEPFQRLHRDDEFSGTGIGLSNVKQVIERHGGRVWVESEPGKGSTFRFVLG